MQRLIYENILGEQVEFYHAPFVLCSVQGTGMNELKISAVSGSYQQGEVITGLKRESRRVKVALHLMAKSREELYRLRSELVGRLSPDKAFDGTKRARIIYQNDFCTRWTWATPEYGSHWNERKQNVHPSLTVTFRCESPFWYGMEKKETVFLERKTGFKLPMQLPFQLGNKVFGQVVYNGGTNDTPVRITVVGNGEAPQLLNKTTGAVIRLVSPLPYGDVLAVDTDSTSLRAVIRHTDGSEENGFGLLSPESSVSAFWLKPGMNELKYVAGYGGSSSEIRVSWYERFEGV